MSKLKTCPACSNQVAKSAKKCPQCGKKLKMGFFSKLLIGFVVLVGIAVVLAPSEEEQNLALSNEIDAVAGAEPSADLVPSELQQIFALGSQYTDVQRDNTEEQITGKVAEWELEVYEVNKRGENEYRVQTSGGSSAPGAFISLRTRSPVEVAYVESLKTGDTIRFKGRVSGTTMRNIDFDPAVLVDASAG